MCDFERAHFEDQRFPMEKSTDKLKVYKIFLYVKQFRPKDICIKVLDKNLVISGKHNEQLDLHGLVTREFRCTYAIPEEFESKSVSSIFGSHGVLKIFILNRKLWEEYNKMKARIFSGYVNLYSLDPKCDPVRLPDQYVLTAPLSKDNAKEKNEAVIFTATLSRDNAKEKNNAGKSQFETLNSSYGIELCDHLIEFRGRNKTQQQSSKSKYSTASLRKEQDVVLHDTGKKTVQFSAKLKNSGKSMESHQPAEASELPTLMESLEPEEATESQTEVGPDVEMEGLELKLFEVLKLYPVSIHKRNAGQRK